MEYSVPTPISRRYYPLSLDDTEDVEGYGPGGFHPVHLGDIYEGRYRVIHKLGAGGYSTTWLARDEMEKEYVALKVIKASEGTSCTELRMLQCLAETPSEHPGQAHFRGLQSYFTINGPHGEHCCLVTEVAGPMLPSLYDYPKRGFARRMKASIARKFAKQIAQALSYLHSNSIGHGDITLRNVLLKLKSIDTWTEDDIYDRLGMPRKEVPRRTSELVQEDSAPRHIVQAARVPEERFLAKEVFLIDLGVSFSFDALPKPKDIGVPLMYRAPETMFDSKYSRASDIWALGCLLLEMRAGAQTFESFLCDADGIVRQWVQTKSKLPEPWWSRWDARSIWFQENGKPLTEWPDDRVLTIEYPLDEMISDIGEQDGGADDGDEDNIEQDQSTIWERRGTKVPEDEAQALRDLLSRTLQWIPEERLTIDQIVAHPWIANG